MQAAYKSVFGKDVKIDTKKPKFVMKPPPEDINIDEVLAYSEWLFRNEAADDFQGRCI